MTDTPRFRVHGVPEHFNLPWRLALEEGRFADAGVEVSWTDQPGGTGVLTARLADGEADLVTVLTEGIITAIANGLDAAIVGLWTSTPLLWGAHVAAGSERDGLDDLHDVRFAISRRGSGSHLMAEIVAADTGVELADEQLVVVGDIGGARAALAEGSADVFLWERFMTAPLVATGEFRRVAVVPTPWPGFVIAASRATLDADAPAVATIADIAGARAAELHADPSAAELIADRYGLEIADAAEWLELTDWAPVGPVEPELLDEVQSRLVSAGVLGHAVDRADLVP